jgi:hypothetical protein
MVRESRRDKPTLQWHNSKVFSTMRLKSADAICRMSESQTHGGIPDSVQWERSCCCCGAIAGSMRHFYCGYWKCEPCMPVFTGFFICYCYSFFIASSVVHFTSVTIQIISVVETTLTLGLFAWAYYGTVCRDPGYLPYDWERTRRTKYSWRELMTGTAVAAAHFSYVDSVPRPPGCSFSKSYGRYVIRADHICGIVGNWIAKRNHKQFLLMLLWGTVACASLFVWRFCPTEAISWKSPVRICDLFAAVIEGVFLLILAFSGISFFHSAASSQTRVQQHKGEKPAERTMRESLSLICGNGPICCWFCPTSAFQDDIILDDLDESLPFPG